MKEFHQISDKSSSEFSPLGKKKTTKQKQTEMCRILGGQFLSGDIVGPGLTVESREKGSRKYIKLQTANLIPTGTDGQ